MNKENDNNKTYEQGLDDAWEAAKKIALYVVNGGYDFRQLKKIFGIKEVQDIFKIVDAAEAVAKIKAYEDKQNEMQNEINIGDEVMFCISGGRKNLRGTVIGLDDNATDKIYHIWVLSENSFFVIGDYALRKTGKHYPQVEELVKAMKGE